jgi:hypothetical protein
MPLAGEFFCEVPQRLGRPPQRRHRITAFVWLAQCEQRLDETRVRVLDPFPASSRPSDPPSRQRLYACFQLGQPGTDRGLADTGDPRHRANTAMTWSASWIGSARSETLPGSLAAR